MIAAAHVHPDPYRQSFAKFTAGRREPVAIVRLRREAFARFEAIGWPTRRFTIRLQAPG